MKHLRPSLFLRRKMQRQAFGDWKQYLAIVLMGVIATTLFVGLLSNAQSLSNRVESFYASSNLPDVWVVTKSHESADEQYIRGLLDEGDTYDKRFQINGRLESSTAYCNVTPSLPVLSHPVEVIAKDDTLTDDDFFYIDKGLWAKADSTSTSKLDIGVEASYSFNVKSYFEDIPSSFMYILDRYAKDKNVLPHRTGEITLTSTINGIMTYGENIQQASYYASSFLVSTSRFKQAIEAFLDKYYVPGGKIMISNYLGTNFPPMNEHLIKFKDSAKIDPSIEKIRDYFSKKSSNNLVEILDRNLNPWAISANTEVAEATQLTFVFPMVFFFVALLVILTTSSQIIIKERIQIGTLKAIGLTRREIYFHYLSLIFSLTTLSCVIGFIVGPLLLPAIMSRKYNILYTLPARELFVFPLPQALACYVVFVGLALLVAFLCCRKEVRLSPSESMRAAPIQYHKFGKAKENKPKSAGLLSLKMGLRNIVVSRYKSIMATIGVMGCAALLVCGFGIDDTLHHSVDSDISFFYSTSLTGTYSSTQKENVPGFANIQELESYDQYLSSNIKASSEKSVMSTNLYLLSDTHPYCHVEIPEGKVAISQKLEVELGLHVGDKIQFTYLNNSFEGEIGAIYTTFIVHGIMGYHKDFPSFEGYNAFWANTASGYSDAQLASAIKEALGEKKIDRMRTLEEMRENINSILSGISVMTNAVKVFAIALALVVLYNLSLLNYRERMRDIATLKVLGFSLKEISLSLIFESMTLTLAGSILGAAVGFPFMYLVLWVNRVSMVEFLYHISPWMYLLAFMLTFVVSLLVNISLSYFAKRVKMVESLKSVE